MAEDRTEVKRVVVDEPEHDCAALFLNPEYMLRCTGSCEQGGKICCRYNVNPLDNYYQFEVGDVLIEYSDGTVELIKQEATRHD